MSQPLNKKFLYALSFTEGGAVMATELIGARVLAPYFGTSLYVWTCVMALTLGGLAGGYFWGGRLSEKEDHEKILMRTVLLAAAYVCVLPAFGGFFVWLAGLTSLLPAALAGSAVVLLPPVFMLGMVSPLLIKSLTEKAEQSGRKAGEVYAISTVGGITFCFLTGLYLVPQCGLNFSLFMISVLLAVFPLWYFFRRKNFTVLLVYLLCAAFILYRASAKAGAIYSSEGLLGKLEVRDGLYSPGGAQQPDSCRLLLINNVIQSALSLRTGQSRLEYTQLLQQSLDSLKRKPQSALILGMGGGILATELSKKNIKVTAVELDARVAEVARNYFGLDKNVHVILDDARHALYRLDQKYDLVVLDLFHGETAPPHVFSLESFLKIRSLLTENGIIFINTYGYLKDAAGQGNLILLHTLEKAGLHYKICYAGDKTHEDFRNFEIFCSAKPITENLPAQLDEKIPDLSAVPVNTDERPVLEYANAHATKRWRYTYLRNFIDP